MLYTGRKVDAATAESWGLVARMVPHDDLMAESWAALEACCRTAPNARTAIKQNFDAYYGQWDRIAMEAGIGNPETIEGFTAFKERRSPSWVPEELREDGRL